MTFIFVILSILFLVKEKNVSAQNSIQNVTPPSFTGKTNQDFVTVYAHYSQKLEDYRRSKNAYETARLQYLKSKTQKSIDEAKEKTIEFLTARDEVIISYLEVLKVKLQTNEGIDNLKLSSLVLKIDSEIGWYQKHRDFLSSAGTLEDLVADSKEASQRYTSTKKLIYEALGNITYGQIVNYRDRIIGLLNRLKGKVAEIELEKEKNSFSNEKIYEIDRGVFQVDNLIIRVDNKLQEADGVISQISQTKSRSDPQSLYNNSIVLSSEARQYLREGSTVLLEIVKNIKVLD